MQSNNKLNPTSFGQERIWSICQSAYEVALYNIGFSMHLVGEFDASLAEQSLNHLVKRHEALRTTFKIKDNRLTQIIAPELTLKLPLIYRESTPVDSISAEIARIASAETQKQFDLQNGPLIRSLLIKFAENHYGWIVVMHHIISDGWSVGLFIYESNIIYQALATKNAINLAAVPLQQSEFSHDQKLKMQSTSINHSLHYWQRRLLGIEKKIQVEISSDQVTYKRYYHSFAPALIKQLGSLSKEYNATLFMLFLIAFRIVFWQKTGQHNSIITVPVANRNSFKLQRTLGYLINLLPIKIAIPDNNFSSEFFAQAITDIRNDFSHPDIPIEYLSNYLQLSPIPSENPFYQTLFSLQNYPIPKNIYNYKIVEWHDYFDLTEFNLSVRISTYKNSGEMEVIYKSECYTDEMIESLIQAYQECLLMPSSPVMPSSSVMPACS